MVGLFFGLSYVYGERVTKWVRDSELGVTVVVVLAVLAVICYFLIRRYRNRRGGNGISELAADERIEPGHDAETCVEPSGAQSRK